MKLLKVLSLAAMPLIALSLASCSDNDIDTTTVKNIETVDFVPAFNNVLAPVNIGDSVQTGITETAWDDYFENLDLFLNNGVLFSRNDISTDEDEKYNFEYTIYGTKANKITLKILNLWSANNITTRAKYEFFGITMTDSELDLLDPSQDISDALVQSAANLFDFQVNLDLPTTVNESPVVAIAPRAFFGPIIGVETVNFNRMSYLEIIGTNAFENNNISCINIDSLDYLTNIGTFAFAQNNITSVTLSNLENLTAINENTFNGNKIVNVNLTNLDVITTIAVNAFANNEIENVTLKNLSNEITANFTIANGAFRGNNVQKLTLAFISFGTTGNAVANAIQNVLTNAFTTVTILNPNMWLTFGQFNQIYALTPGFNVIVK